MEACSGKNYEDYRYAEGGNFKLRHITVARKSRNDMPKSHYERV